MGGRGERICVVKRLPVSPSACLPVLIIHNTKSAAPQSAYVRLRRRAYANIEQLFCERQSNEIFKGCWMKNVYLAGAVRTPIGRYGGALAGLVMGQTAENLARQYRITREEQDEFALRSQRRAADAIESGRFDSEIVPVKLKGRKGEDVTLARDEHPRADTTTEALRKLPPVFAEDGTVTAGNSSGITDG